MAGAAAVARAAASALSAARGLRPAVSVLVLLSLPAAAVADGHGRRIYLEWCASCHGRDLEGQPDWQVPLPSGRLPAPPHDASGHTWHHPDRVLFAITKYGPQSVLGPDYESDMPAFAGVLDDEEIRAVLDYIRSTWPEPQRRFQQERTREDERARTGGAARRR